ncbi:MAG TPA: hypothetical protein VIM87_29700 [Chitinophaga sp.]|uniref:hypothetical protein n=1 Tax=Chitinophaga sp. TaxID=1869181 RepID=UPI002F94163F
MRRHIPLTGLITGVLAIHVLFMWMEISSCNAIQEELAAPDSSRMQKMPEQQVLPLSAAADSLQLDTAYTTGIYNTW